jgi:hypothetical protein
VWGDLGLVTVVATVVAVISDTAFRHLAGAMVDEL